MRNEELFSAEDLDDLGQANLCSSPTAAAVDYFYKWYQWDYGGSRWTLNTQVPKSLYHEYCEVSVSERTRNGLAGYGFLVTTQDPYVNEIVDSLYDAAARRGFDTFDEVSFVLSFVQSLRYTSDSVSTGYDEYPRFPVETLMDEGGDCEDTAILFATLVLILDYDAVFINPPNHYAVGVWGTDLHGSYYMYNNKRYYYCETTGDNFNIGDMPSEYQGTSAHLYSIDQSSQYTPDQNTTRLGQDLTSGPAPWSAFWVIVIFAGSIASIACFARRDAKMQKPKDVGPPTARAPNVERYATARNVLRTPYSEVANCEDQHIATKWLVSRHEERPHLYGDILETVVREPHPFPNPKNLSSLCDLYLWKSSVEKQK